MSIVTITAMYEALEGSRKSEQYLQFSLTDRREGQEPTLFAMGSLDDETWADAAEAWAAQRKDRFVEREPAFVMVAAIGVTSDQYAIIRPLNPPRLGTVSRYLIVLGDVTMTAGVGTDGSIRFPSMRQIRFASQVEELLSILHRIRQIWRDR